MPCPIITMHDNLNYRHNTVRLKNFDYSGSGVYFVTVCTKNMECLLGSVVNGYMLLNKYGKLALDTLKWLEKRYPYVLLDYYVIMPNHIHCIIVISRECRGGSRTAPTYKYKPLGRLVGAFKTVSTKKINMLNNTPGIPFWQRNFYDRIIRNEKEYKKIREYIYYNPKNWDHDEENPDNIIVGARRAVPV